MLLLTVLGSLPRLLGAAEVWAARPARAVRGMSVLELPPGTRLVVMSPHPDDETLGAAGLIQSVLSRGGSVWVVYFTCGDGFSLAARRAFEKVTLAPPDYRRLGEARREEALRALSRLGVPASHAVFLGFPDQGLLALWSRSWARGYRSPYTHADAVPYPDAWRPGRPYTGRELQAELERFLAQVRPDVVVATGLTDFHPDHKAVGLFTRRALEEARARREGWAERALYLEYVIHQEEWRRSRDRALLHSLGIPRAEAAGDGPWVYVPLTPDQVQAKRQAIAAYRTQTAVMSGFLYTFAGRNEPFHLVSLGSELLRARTGS